MGSGEITRNTWLSNPNRFKKTCVRAVIELYDKNDKIIDTLTTESKTTPPNSEDNLFFKFEKEYDDIKGVVRHKATIEHIRFEDCTWSEIYSYNTTIIKLAVLIGLIVGGVSILLYDLSKSKPSQGEQTSQQPLPKGKGIPVGYDEQKKKQSIGFFKRGRAEETALEEMRVDLSTLHAEETASKEPRSSSALPM